MNNKETTTELSENNNHVKVFLPNKLLECLPKCTFLPKERLRWNTNEEIASYLITFEKHEEWLSLSLKTRPQNGSIVLYNRKKVKYRKDGYCWKKRKDGKTTREDHMKLKVQGMECLYGCYVHSSIVPTFHRRCYWLLQNPDIVLVHYLNVPAIEDCGKICGPILCSINSDRKEWQKWSKEELIAQLKPMFHGVKWTCSNGNGTTEFSIEQLVQQILESHQAKPQPRTHACLCSGGLGTTSNIPHKCNSTKHRIISPKVEVRSCPYPALTEVQNLSASEPKLDSEQDNRTSGNGIGRGMERKESNQTMSQGEKGKLEVQVSPVEASPFSSSQSSASSDGLDSNQTSPAGALSSTYFGDQRVSAVASLPVATVTCGLPQNAVIVMTTGLTTAADKATVALTPSQQLIATETDTTLPSISSHHHSSIQLTSHSDVSLVSSANDSVGLALVPVSDGGLMLSESLDASMDTTETSHTLSVTADFDPDSFLNSPKQGQTYGGAANQDSLSVSFSSPSSICSSETGNGENEKIIQPSSCPEVTSAASHISLVSSTASVNTLPISLLPAATAQTFSHTLGVGPTVASLVGSSSALPDKMDCSNTNSDNSGQDIPVSSVFQQNQGNCFFIQDNACDEKMNSSRSRKRNSTTSKIKVKTESRVQNVGAMKEEKLSPGQKPLSVCDINPEVETPMDTNVDLEKHQVEDLPAEEAVVQVKVEGLEVIVESGTSNQVTEITDIQGGNMSDLYTIIQKNLGPTVQPLTSSGTDVGLGLNLMEHLEISFDSQLPDLISEFIAEDEGGSGTGSAFQFSSCTSAPSVPVGQLQIVQVSASSHPQSFHISPTSCTTSTAPLTLPESIPQSVAACVTTASFTKVVPSLAPVSHFINHIHPQHLQQISSSSFHPYSELTTVASASSASRMEAQQLVNITDFSPEWSYPEGGVKVLITGPWIDGSDLYSCIFDQITVPASLIQSGVLRCYCPAHEAGLVALQVALENQVISASVLFEYRARNSMVLPSTQMDWLSLDDNQFRMSILERLEQMEKRMAEMTASNQHQNLSTSTQQTSRTTQQQKHMVGEKTPSQVSADFEERIMAVCEKMMSRSCWLRSEHLVHEMSFRGMTLLHLAAAQGYGRLIETLIHWRNVNSQNLDLEQEVDPLNVDHFSCTPLMWACALGHLEAAVILYQWNSQALAIPDSLGRLPLNVARSRGHVRLATCLEEMQQQQQQESREADWRKPPLQDTWQDGERGNTSGMERGWLSWAGRTPEAPQIPSPLSTSPDTGLSTSSSLPSPSDISEASLSLTSAYSSGSLPRESPAYSPDSDTQQEIAMDISEPQVRGSRGLAQLTMENIGPSVQHPSLPSWYLQEEQAALKSRSEASLLLEYEASISGGGAPRGFASSRDTLEAELLNYSENVENEEYLPAVDVLQVDMFTLAEQIIEATPERIKQEDFGTVESPLRERQDNMAINQTMPWLASYLETVDQLPNFSQHRSVCSEPMTPPSPHLCLSPVNSPLSDLTFEKLDTPTAADWSEFLNASANGKMESEFALLTLSDHEQRELYEAARIIQTAFRKYKGRRLKEQQEMAAAVIQRCYRKYKQYALYKKMTQAAILIQSKFRSYYEQKKFQQSRRAAVLIQQYYRSYKEYERLKQSHRGTSSMQQKIKGSFLTKKQDQAARKIMRFLRRCRHRIKELKQNKELESLQKRSLAT
ncbi:calmodulin-binding transcription activator 2 isoform X2 [Polypterus senegalus]|uniref:calmodulin-binding transcription activator 2 isoform X2 n=1 Tax=Polypterus senegalus TaxID=55291 RepID=UPI0019666A1E|nr:calmodulin-binding transcription activator 2 isoform X2 [Polypterus senegalus]